MITISSPEVGPSKYFLITITVAHMLVRIFYFPDNPGYGTGTGARVKSLWNFTQRWIPNTASANSCNIDCAVMNIPSMKRYILYVDKMYVWLKRFV